MCKVYSICNQKGGCGKSNVSVNLAAALQRKDARFLWWMRIRRGAVP